MALLKGGKIYDIDFKGLSEEAASTTLVRNRVMTDFSNLYKQITGITDSNYYYFETYGDYDNQYWCLLPYINQPETYNNIALVLYVPYGKYGSYCNDLTFSFRLGYPYSMQYDFVDATYYDLNNNYYTMTMNNENYNHTNNPTINNFKSNLFFRFDTRFLDTHKFYTINYAFYTGTLQEIYFSPTIIVYDAIDQITGKHSDDIIYVNKYPDYKNYQYYSDDNNYYHFRPQLYSNQDNSIVLQKFQTGRLKSDTIYLTNASKFNNLEALVNYQKMSEYKDCWLKNKLYSNGKSYIMGVASPQKSDYSVYDGTTAPYIPVIVESNFKSKIPSWSTGTDAEITAVINDYRNGIITEEEIREVWHEGDCRKIHLSAMPSVYGFESHQEQDVEMYISKIGSSIIGWIHNELNNPCILITQKECLIEEGPLMVDSYDRRGSIQCGWGAGGWWGTFSPTPSEDCWFNDVYYNALPNYLKQLIQLSRQYLIGNAYSDLYTYAYCFFDDYDNFDSYPKRQKPYWLGAGSNDPEIDWDTYYAFDSNKEEMLFSNGMENYGIAPSMIL